jgi:hypothetical protein
VAELLDISYPEVCLSKGHRTITDWWDVVGMIYTKWKV